jgi:type III pantothenate kinase
LKLYVDIGNSNIKLVTFDENFSQVITLSYSKSSTSDLIFDALSKLSVPDKVICINVAGEKVYEQFFLYCTETWNRVPVLIDIDKSYPIQGVKTGYHEPTQLGIDRWMAIIAAWNRVNNKVMVIDAGSALTIDLVNEEGQHLGGYIVPGSYLMAKSLLDNTKILSDISTDGFGTDPGHSTAECIANGSGRALISLIMDIFRTINENQQVHYKCIITGGGAKKIIEHLPGIMDYQPLLIFEGMQIAEASQR